MNTQFRSRFRHGRSAQAARTTGLSIADRLESLRRTAEPIEVTFNTADAPPSYGDFLNVVMVARFLAMSGFEVTFRIRDTGTRRADWGDLTPDQQEVHLDDCSELASVLLRSSASVEWSEQPLQDDTNAPTSPLENQPEPAYIVAESIFHVLLEQLDWDLPDRFLLTGADFAEPADSQPGPYVSWHVRRGIWEKGRDNTPAGVLSDIRQLRAAFPDHDLMVFSSPLGLEFARSHLADSPRGLDRVIFQPEPGFLAAASYVLASDFYFQRRGGGLSQVAVYSAVPYLILNDHASYYYLRQGDRLVPWASDDQRYVIKRGVSGLSIADFVAR